MATEDPKIRIGRIFGMGKYGYQLAEEILLDFQMRLEEELRRNGYESAAEYLIDRRGPCVQPPEPTSGLAGTEAISLPN